MLGVHAPQLLVQFLVRHQPDDALLECATVLIMTLSEPVTAPLALHMREMAMMHCGWCPYNRKGSSGEAELLRMAHLALRMLCFELKACMTH